MKTLALVGLADSWVKVHDFDCEVWTLNCADDFGVPRISLLFDLHTKEKIAGDGRWELLKEPRDYPVVLLHPEYALEIPNSIAYPLEEVTAELFQHLYRGPDENVEYYTSTFDYMLAYAITTEPDLEDIYVIGFEFGSETEYRYQKEGALLLTGLAAGRGVNVHFMGDGGVLPRTLYGYEDYQMISRQFLEATLSNLTAQNSAALGRLNKWQALLDGGAHPDAQDEATKAFKSVYLTGGAMYLADYLIKECDRRAPPELQMKDPLFQMDKEGNIVEGGKIKVKQNED